MSKLKKSGSPLPSRTESAPAPEPAKPELKVDLEHLTVLEDDAEFGKVLKAFVEDLAPANAAQALLAEEVAASFWMQRRYSSVATQQLSIDIERNQAKLLQQFPKADGYLQTAFAHDRLQTSPGYRHALAEYDKAFRRTVSLYHKVRGYRKGR